MLDEQGRLSDQDKQKIADWLDEKWTQPSKCSVCGHSDWTLGEHLVNLQIYYGGGLRIGGPTYPYVMVICKNCAQTLFFNAVMLGLIPSGKEKDGGK